ncbi:NAD(P)/FAD-dependent oxidoreductase [Paraburkholderia megapolitana]|uniref:NAD(P)/FAD-dependent oxidoreductase n=1 Tax=Paraburkholderia megapolitana TaxID=420953 RepID=UPI0038B830DD
MNTEAYDTVIVGGSYAGMSAALPLARARRRILVIDGGKRRNRFVEASHGFLGQDGRHPADIAADARKQLLRYATVQWIEGDAVHVSGEFDAFQVALEDGTSYAARRLILATGVTDELPDIAGLAERWGKSVFICPYCDGYELNEGRIGVIATGPMGVHQALLLPDWGTTTLFMNGHAMPEQAEVDQLAARGVRIETGVVRRIDGRATIVLEDGRHFEQDGIFTGPRMRLSSPLAAQLGCDIDDSAFGEMIRTDGMKTTSVRGVYACGDATQGAKSVAIAVGDGYMTGAVAHRSLIFD